MISLKQYLESAQALMDGGRYTDGCSVPLIRELIHSWLSRSKLLCAAHDYGNLGYIDGISPGLHNQFYTLAAHLWNWNPIYWLWGLIVFIGTMPWVLYARNICPLFGWVPIRIDYFHGILAMGSFVTAMVTNQMGYWG